MLNLGKFDEALALIDDLREISLSRLDDGELDLLAASTLYHLGKLIPARTAALGAIATGEAMGDARLTAQGQFVNSMILDQLGDRNAAQRAWEAARLAAAQIGDRLILLDAFRLSINNLLRRGQIDEALDQFQRHRNLYQDAGDPVAEASIAHNLAILLKSQDPDTAATLLNEARTIFRRHGRRFDAAFAEYSLGVLALLRGRLAAAGMHYQAALETFTELGSRKLRAWALNALGELAFFAGDFDQALGLYRQALNINSAMPNPSGVAYNTSCIADVLQRQGELETAYERYMKSLDIWEELGDVKEAAETRIGLARLELARKNFGNALTQARDASRASLEVDAMDLHLLAQITEARVYLEQGDVETSRKLYDEIELNARQSFDRRVDFETRLLAARLSEDSAERTKMLEQLAADATDGGDLLYAAEARTQLEAGPWST